MRRPCIASGRAHAVTRAYWSSRSSAMASGYALKPGFVAGLDGTKVAGLHQVTLRRLQRLAGHGLLIRNQALEDAGDSV